MRSTYLILLELLYVASALWLGKIIVDRVDIIPQSILPAKHAIISNSELLIIVVAYLLVSIPIFVIYRFACKGSVFFETKRTVSELYAVALVSSISGTAIFLLTTINFDADFFLISFFLTVSFFVATLFLVSWRTQQDSESRFAWLRSFTTLLVRSLISRSALVAILVAALPLSFAFSYKNIGSVANVVNRTKVGIIQSIDSRLTDYQWTLANAYPGINFQGPMDLQFSPGDNPEAYVLERAGKLYRVSGKANLEKELVLDFRAQVGEVKSENGALGFALHPQFGTKGAEEKGYVYIYYTHVRPRSQHNRLSRFDLSAQSAQERLASETLLIEQQRTASGVHNGGSVEFGPDSFLYLAIGDGFTDVNFQRIDRGLFSGIIRIDVDMKGGDVSHPIIRQPVDGHTEGYFIPNDNPFSGQADSLEEFWAIGLRNPFRMSFDGETGNLWAGDVGLSSFEEINIVEKGGNYQWPYVEGPVRNTKVERPKEVLGTEVAPFHYYPHTSVDRAIIGGIVYRGEKFPGLIGKYIFGDNFSGRIVSINAEDSRRAPKTLTFAAYQDRFGLTSFTESPQGDVLITILGDPSRPAGKVLRLARLENANDEGTAFAKGSSFQTSAEPTLETARQVYSRSCARCHGESGKGDGVGLAELDVMPPNFSNTEWQKNSTDDYVRRVIEDGGAAVGLSNVMPAWKGALTTDQIGKLVGVIRTFGLNPEGGGRVEEAQSRGVKAQP